MLSQTSCCSAGRPLSAQGRTSMPARRQAGTQVGACTPHGHSGRLPAGCIRPGTGRQASASQPAPWTALSTLWLIRLSRTASFI